MAVIEQGILGGLSGKVGQVIGASWRGINYVRIYATPSNPQTASQMVQRNKFHHCVKCAKSVLSTVINKFWETMYPKMSGFNAFIKYNIDNFSDTLGATEDVCFSSGTLEKLPTAAATYAAGTGVVTVTIDPTCISNGQATDKVALVVYDNLNKYAYVNDAALVRSSGTGTLNLPAGLTHADLFVYAFAYKGTAPNYIQSNTTGFGNPTVA